MGAPEGGGVVSGTGIPAWVKEQRVFGFLADIDKLAEILLRHPDKSVYVAPSYMDSDGWLRVTVQVGTVAVFCPRFESHDDAVSFRLRAVEMTTHADPC